MSRSCYEIKVVGTLGAAARAAFGDLLVDVEPTSTVLSGSFEQDRLHELLERVQALGLELVEVRQMPAAPMPDRAGRRGPD